MHLKPISVKDIPDIKDIKNEFDRMHVLVEWQTIISLNNPKVIKCYVPAYAHKDKDTIIVCYEHHPKGSYDPYFVEFAYHEDNMPDLYEFTSIGIRECLLLALGVLLAGVIMSLGSKIVATLGISGLLIIIAIIVLAILITIILKKRSKK